MSELTPLDHTAPNYRQRFEDALAVEAVNIETRQIRDLADRVLVESLYKDGKFNCVRFVDHILKSFPEGTFITPMNDQGGDVVWRYDETRGIFVNDGIPFTEKALKDIMGQDTTTAQYAHVVKHLQVETYTQPADFEEIPEIIVTQNGALNVFSGELLPHSPHYKARSAIPVTYNPDAGCPRFQEFFKRVIPSQEYREFFQEWAGFHLIKDYRFQRVTVLVGDGDNGKSTLLNVLTRLLGKENVSSENLYRLTTNRFSPAELYGKLANVAADIGPDELKYTGPLKTLTGGDSITAERKRRDPFKFINHAKMTFSCNQLPRTPDETLAFYKRFIVIITGDPIPKEEQNPQILEEITTQEELSGILNWALIGLRNAITRGRLAEPTEILERKELYRNMSDPVTGFIETHIVENPETHIIKEDAYRAFAQYCKRNGYIANSTPRSTKP